MYVERDSSCSTRNPSTYSTTVLRVLYRGVYGVQKRKKNDENLKPEVGACERLIKK